MIGIFDSGMGGLTVLEKCQKILPFEDFIYIGDSKNVPYGIKKKKKVAELSINICDYLIDKYDVKAIIVACNTATSAAIDILRNRYNIPIIGMEPAIKPAIEDNRGKKIAVLATEMTLKEKKFNGLLKKLDLNNKIIKIPCSKLVNLIETTNFNRESVDEILDECILNIHEIESIVLGCTHFVYIKEYLLKKYQKYKLKVYDGNEGTAFQLKRILGNDFEKNDKKGNIIIENTGKKEILKKSKNLYIMHKERSLL